MNVLRRLPLSRLVLACAAVVALGSGVALANSLGNGPTPPPASLADAVHAALTASPVDGVSANVTFTNNLLANDSLSGPSSPVLSGGDGRLWVTSSGDVRLELQSDGGDTEIYYSGGTLAYYDPSNGGTLYRVPAPDHGSDTAPPASHEPPSVAQIQQAITRLEHHVDVSGAIPSDVAGRAAYEVRLTPSSGGALFGGVGLWWDAAHGLPLQAAVYATGNPDPVLELSATSVSYGPIDPSVFVPPAAAHTVTESAAKDSTGSVPTPSFAPGTPPATLDGKALARTRTFDVGRHPATLLLYGKGLGAIAVLERPADRGAAGAADSGSGESTVQIGGVTATDIPTALGTLVRFMRDGVAYVVAGSLPKSDVVQAAGGL